MQETWVQSLGQEDPTCCGATKPMCHNYWAQEAQQGKPLQSEAHTPQLEEAPAQQQTPRAAENKLINKK